MQNRALSNEVANMRILKIVMQRSGTYNQQYVRPYETNVRGAQLQSFIDRVSQANTINITPGVIADLAGSVLTPSSRPLGAVDIRNGWSTPREKFIIVAEVTFGSGLGELHYIQGYTDHPGVITTISNITNTYGAVDPNLIFNVNSVSKVNIVQNYVNGVQSQNRRLLTADQVITNNHNNGSYGIRPIDVVNNINSKYTLSTITELGEYVSTIDTRSMLGVQGSVCNRRSNNIPSNYLSSFLTSYVSSAAAAGWDDNEGDILNDCRSDLQEHAITQNPFIATIAKTGINLTSWFTWSDLLAAFPYADNVLTYVENTNMEYSNIHQAGMTENLDSMTREAIAASLLAQSIPAIMVQTLINKISFYTTNRDIGGLVTTAIVDFKLFSQENQEYSLDLFKSRFEREIFKSISFDNSDIVDLTVQCDLYGETWIKISINGGPQVPFVYPTFCDGLITPVVTNGEKQLDDVSAELEMLAKTCSDTMWKASGRNQQTDELFGHF